MCPSPTITFISARLPRMETAPLVRLKRSRRGRERRQRGLSQSSVIRSAQVNCSCQTKLCTTAASTAMAVEAAVVHNFVWHEQFTWADRMTLDCDKPRWRRSLPRLLRFNLTNGAVSILGNLALMKVMVGEGHMNYLVANGIAITLFSLANFLVSETWVFAKPS